MQTGKRKCGLLVTGIAVVSLLAGSAALAADRVVVIPLGGSKSYIVPDDNSACDAARAGLMRFTGSIFEGCNGTEWVSLSPVPTVYSSGHEWMDRNMGASRVATGIADIGAYGDLYQWGRFTDGHEKRANSLTTTSLSSSDDPGHSKFITNGVATLDWRSPQNGNLWQVASGINNPCPVGFRLPTDTEWEAEMLSWVTRNAVGAYGSPLKIVASGYRSLSKGSLMLVGSAGLYWSSTVDGFKSRSLSFYSTSASIYSSGRASGASVRCLKD